jgi:hypothetical protein
MLGSGFVAFQFFLSCIEEPLVPDFYSDETWLSILSELHHYLVGVIPALRNLSFNSF